MTLGIIGGCGPAAGAYFYTRLIEMTDAREDSGHINVLLSGRADTPDRTAALLCGGPSPLYALTESARVLVQGGADLLILLCHTAHVYLPALRATVRVPILDMVDITLRGAAARGVCRLGVLCTAGTQAARLYDRAAEARGIAVVYPDAENGRALQEAIYTYFKQGRSDGGAAIRNAALSLIRKGCDGISLSCTELSLPVAHAPAKMHVWQAGERLAPIPVLDPFDLLLRRVISLFGKKIKAEEEMRCYAFGGSAAGAPRRPLAAR